MKQFAIFIFISMCFYYNVNAQEEKCKPSLNISADFVSSYIWRGLPGFGMQAGTSFLAPCIQPSLIFGNDKFEIGTWGSVNLEGSYMETDFFASYSFSGFSFFLTDYFAFSDNLEADLFDCNKDSTAHIVEASIEWCGEKIPLHILAATMIFGNDKEADPERSNNYSTYFELGYNLKVKENDLDIFLGCTPGNGYYNSYDGTESLQVVNLGLTGNRTIQINDKLELPVSVSFITNPHLQRAFFVFKATL